MMRRLLSLGAGMKRRAFITLVGGAAAWPLVVIAKEPDRIRRIGMLVTINDPEIKAFKGELEKLGWSEGRNIQIDYRVAPGADNVETFAKELVAMQPDVIFALGRPTTAALQNETHTIPIVFTYVIDPIGAGFIASLARPGGNITGILGLRRRHGRQMAGYAQGDRPQTSRAALLANPKTAAYYDYLLHGAEAAAPSLGIEIVRAHIENDAADIERAIAAIASVPNSAMVVLPESTANFNTNLIITLAAHNRLPTVYNFKFQVHAGGLMSYGILAADHYRQAALYVDQILRGAKPSDLPVQTPTKYETVLNRKTANALGLIPPEALLVAADEVIE